MRYGIALLLILSLVGSFGLTAQSGPQTVGVCSTHHRADYVNFWDGRSYAEKYAYVLAVIETSQYVWIQYGLRYPGTLPASPMWLFPTGQTVDWYVRAIDFLTCDHSRQHIPIAELIIYWREYKNW